MKVCIWKEEESLNPKNRRGNLRHLQNAGILTADEIARRTGQEPLPEQVQPEPNKQDDQQPEERKPNQEAEKLGENRKAR